MSTAKQNEYDAYVAYCKTHNIEVVSREDYFETLHERMLQAYYGENDFR